MGKVIKSNTPNFFSKRPLLTGYYNEKFWMYMNNLWEDPAEYKVLMARRMFNMNYALMHEWDVSEDRQYLINGIMSNTAFLLSAKTIAERYASRNSFPRILICDDIMLHGRGIINLITKFQKLIMEYLAEIDVQVSERRLHLDLYSAISIYVFARNKDEGLLIDKSKYRLFTSEILSMNHLRELSIQISDYLRSCGVANTSYVLSARLPWHQLRVLSVRVFGNNTEEFRYKGRSQHVFFRERSPRILETMRICYPSEDSMDGGILTSLPVYGDISRDSFNTLCRLIANYMEQNARHSQIAVYLRRENDDLIKPKAQLVTFIYSILSMADFCRQNLQAEDGEIYKTLVGGDYSKIIANFDTSDFFRYEILSLCKNVSTNVSAGSMLWTFLDEAAQDLSIEQKKYRYSSEFRYVSGPEKTKRKKKYEDAEDIFYEVGMDAEYDAFRYTCTGEEYDSKRPGYDLISFRQYMHIMSRKRDSKDHSIGCMFGLMDGGLISMNLEADRDINGQMIRTVLKAGELSTYILPRRFSVFVPALAEVESRYKSVGNYVGDVISSFVDYLQDYCYKGNGSVDLRDEQILKTLQKKKSLLMYLYAAGQKFQDWNIDLRNERQYSSNKYFENEDGFSYDEEQVRKKHYLWIAKQYINQ